MTTTSRRALVLVVALLAAALSAVALGAPASAARTVDVVLTDREPTPVALRPGDSVRFVNGESNPLFPHRVTATERDGSTPWRFDSGSLAPGQSATHTFATAGTYLFVDRRGGLGPLGQDRFGRIAVTPPPPPPPAPPQQQVAPPPPPAPAPSRSSAPVQPAAPAAPGPAGTGATAGTGVTGLVDPGALTAPLAAEAVVPPAVAELLRDAGTPPAAEPLPPVQALQGPLPGAGTSRPLGLPATLAALAAAGVASLLVRVLLAEPAAARSRALVPVQVQPAA